MASTHTALGEAACLPPSHQSPATPLPPGMDAMGDRGADRTPIHLRAPWPHDHRKPTSSSVAAATSSASTAHGVPRPHRQLPCTESQSAWGPARVSRLGGDPQGRTHLPVLSGPLEHLWSQPHLKPHSQCRSQAGVVTLTEDSPFLTQNGQCGVCGQASVCKDDWASICMHV